MEPKTPRKRGPAKQYTRPISLYENDEGFDLLNQLARRWGQSQGAVLRRLIREAAQNQGIQPG